MPCSAAMRCTSESTRSMFAAPPASARAADDGLARPFAAAAYFSNGTWSASAAPIVRHSLLHPVVDLARLLEVAVHRLADRADLAVLHAAIVAGQEHAPLGERYEHRVVDLELDRQLHAARSARPRCRPAASRSIAVCCVRGKARDLEVGRQAHLQHVHLLVRRPERLRVRAAQRHQRGVEAVPHRGIGVAAAQRRRRAIPGMRARYGSGGMFMIDMHGTRGLGDRRPGARARRASGTAAPASRARRDRSRPASTSCGPDGRQLARQLARIDLDADRRDPSPAVRTRMPSALMRSASAGRHTRSHVVAGEQQLGREQGAIRRSQDQNPVRLAHQISSMRWMAANARWRSARTGAPAAVHPGRPIVYNKQAGFKTQCSQRQPRALSRHPGIMRRGMPANGDELHMTCKVPGSLPDARADPGDRAGRRERARRLAVLADGRAVRARADLGGRARRDRASLARAPARADAEMAERGRHARAALGDDRDRAAGGAARARSRQRSNRQRGRAAKARRRRALEARPGPVPASCALARVDRIARSTSRARSATPAAAWRGTCRARSRTRSSSRSP